jgi:GAF domain-containing protein
MSERVTELEAEIRRLRQQLDAQSFATELRESLVLAATAQVLAAPSQPAVLLNQILELAARTIGAAAGSVLLIDESGSELVFEAATGPKADEIMAFRVPLGQGIAGLVAATGQPMAVSEVERDPRHAAEIAESVGYQPTSIVCVPLDTDSGVIGVVELLDKIGAPSFSPGDIELLAGFAQLAAAAVEQRRILGSLMPLMAETLNQLGLLTDEQQRRLAERAKVFVSGLGEDRSYRETLELARLIQRIAGQGEAARTLTTRILLAVAKYQDAERKGATDLFGFGA